jgi:hypothetical protein
MVFEHLEPLLHVETLELFETEVGLIARGGVVFDGFRCE